MAVFWDVAPSILVDTDIIILMMEAVSSSETSININQTTRYNIRLDSDLNLYRILKKFSHWTLSCAS
jgi:hypothetical protein